MDTQRFDARLQQLSVMKEMAEDRNCTIMDWASCQHPQDFHVSYVNSTLILSVLCHSRLSDKEVHFGQMPGLVSFGVTILHLNSCHNECSRRPKNQVSCQMDYRLPSGRTVAKIA